MPPMLGRREAVQYMLRHYYGPPAAHLKVDGYIGPMTIGWIKQFQEVLEESRRECAGG